jgi:hypothetical protein
MIPVFDGAAERLVDLPEKDLVRHIVQQSSTLYHFFNFVVEPALGPPPREGWDYLFYAEVERSHLGLRPGIPGDIDVLIVPTRDGQPVPRLAMAMEVKRLALKGPKWDKNVDRYGVSQAEGLMRCGFPFVGLLHIIVNLDGPSDSWSEVEEWRAIDDSGRMEFVRKTDFDFTGQQSAERQFRRVLSRQPPSELGINCVSISMSPPEVNSKRRLGVCDGEKRFAQANPRVHPRMIEHLGIFSRATMSQAPLRAADARRESGHP